MMHNIPVKSYVAHLLVHILNDQISSSSKQQWVIPDVVPAVSPQLFSLLVAEFWLHNSTAKKFTISTYQVDWSDSWNNCSSGKIFAIFFSSSYTADFSTLDK